MKQRRTVRDENFGLRSAFTTIDFFAIDAMKPEEKLQGPASVPCGSRLRTPCRVTLFFFQPVVEKQSPLRGPCILREDSAQVKRPPFGGRALHCLPERKAYVPQECLRLGAIPRARREGDRETEHILGVFVRRLRKDDVFFEPYGDVTHVVNRGRLYAAEVLHAGKDDVHELVEERVHAFAPKRHLKTHRVSLTALEVGDGFFRRPKRRRLPRDARDALGDKIAPLFVLNAADTGRNDYLGDTRRLHRTRVFE